MATLTITLSKFVGTISLGLLTGSSTTLLLTTLPPLLSLPTAAPALTTFSHLTSLTRNHQFLLSALSSSTLLLAYTLSPRRARHPFLLWATLSVGLGYSREIYSLVLGKRNDGVGEKGKGRVERSASGESSSSSDEEWETDVQKSTASMNDGINGEVVREGMERWRRAQVGKAAAWGVGWVICVVGLWGDGFGSVV